MSLLAATQIPKPLDEQAFERASVILWRCILQDPNVQRNGRRGQRQNGVDLVGIRNGDATHLVGIQCKLKGDGQELTEDEIRKEVEKAKTFEPPLREYFVITTAPDDGELQRVTREIAVELAGGERPFLFHIWGWNTLEERISEHAEARKFFDPDYGPFSEAILEKVSESTRIQTQIGANLGTELSTIAATLTRVEAAIVKSPGDSTIVVNALEANLDAEIDGLRELANTGKPRTALSLLEQLLARVTPTSSGRIQFRVKANIGSCLLALGDDQKAAQLLSEAYDHAPKEPKAAANKALSLLILGKTGELRAFAARSLAEDPTNDNVAGYLVQAARDDDSVVEPFDLLPEQIRSSRPVAIARIDFLRHRNKTPEWHAVAHRALAEYPEDYHAQQFAAEADLEEILNGEEFRRSGLLRPLDRSRISIAAGTFTQQWNKILDSEGVVRIEHIAICNNLIIASHALGDLPKALEVVRQGLTVASNDQHFLIRAALVAIDARDIELARKLLPRLPDNTDAIVLKFRFYSSEGEWEEVAELCKASAAKIPDIERLMMTTAGQLAELKIHPAEDGRDRLLLTMRDVAHDARASIVVADFAHMLGHEDVAEEAYKNAVRAITDHSHFAPRMMVALSGARRRDWQTVASLLDKYIPEDRDSEELQMLATSLVNDTPIRKRAIRFFERLPDTVAELPFYLSAMGRLHFNRGALDDAQIFFRRAIAVRPNLAEYLALFSALRRANQEGEIATIVRNLDLASLDGTPGQRMFIAQELRAAGKKEEAVKYAYQILVGAPNDPEVALRYFGLLMSDTSSRLVPAAPLVALDTWVRLRSDSGELFEFVIEEGSNKPGESILSPKHPLAKLALGLKIGDSFEQVSALDIATKWKVDGIKHKYLHALHDVMENFQTRFPDARGLYRVTMQEGNIQPALDQVRKASETNRKFADLYLLQHFPMSMVANKLGGDSIGFPDYIRSLDRDIETCSGNDVERKAALDAIERHRKNGVVLDAYTAWTVATMDISDVLVSIFGKLVIPQAVVDELLTLKQRDTFSGGPAMSVSWQNGQFFRQEFSKEDIEARVNFISSQVEKIQQHFVVQPIAAPDSPSELASIITETFGSHALDSAYLASEGYLLLSEDLYFRQIADNVASVPGIWLQAVLWFAREHSIITDERYADAVVMLARRRHSHLSLDSKTLWNVFNTDTSTDLERVRAVAQFIGTATADMNSHLSVASTFLEAMWEHGAIPDIKAMRATSVVLECLIRNTSIHWSLMLAFMTQWSNSDFKNYIDRWVFGHFLPLNQLVDAEGKVTQMRNILAVRSQRKRHRKARLMSTAIRFQD